jgi:uncharacterized protein (UPF0276 family)
MPTPPGRLPQGAGLGIRRAFIGPLCEQPPAAVDFTEAAPENWMRIGGRLGKQFRSLTERLPFVCHGLSLSLGGPAPLDLAFLRELKGFLDRHGALLYSEHLSACGDDGQLYDLMPIPFAEPAVRHVAGRIRTAQEILGRRIAIENISYYAAPGQEMAEIDFLKAVLAEADCDLLLDLNNLYVNSVNQGYDAEAFLDAIPAERVAYLHVAGHVAYLHVAGHYAEAADLLIDTHGASVADPVWRLLDRAYARLGVLPTLLERDFNLPPLPALVREVEAIRGLQARPAPPRRRYG